MAEGRAESEWDRFSLLIATLANCHRDGKKKAFEVWDFHPLLRRPTPKKVSVRILKDLFIDSKIGQELAQRRRQP